MSDNSTDRINATWQRTLEEKNQQLALLKQKAATINGYIAEAQKDLQVVTAQIDQLQGAIEMGKSFIDYLANTLQTNDQPAEEECQNSEPSDSE